MNTSQKQTPRIVIYGTGQYGLFITRFAVQKGWPIVAAYNRAGSKVGQDIGRLAGLNRDLGVVVQDCDLAEFSKLQADIGIVTMTNSLAHNMPAYKRLLGAGLNVLCHGGQSYYPAASDAVLAAEIDALAKKNNVTFTGGGIWDMSRIWAGILVAGPCTELTSLFHSSITDMHGQAHTKEQLQQTGAGYSVDEYNAMGFDKSMIGGGYRTIPQQVLVALGYTVTGHHSFIEPVIFDMDIESPMIGKVPAGICVGSRYISEIETKEGVTARSEIDTRLFKPGEVEHMFWSVQGKPVTRIRVERDDSAHATAANLFNRIPDVIAAPPGIVIVSQMGPLKHSALSAHVMNDSSTNAVS